MSIDFQSVKDFISEGVNAGLDFIADMIMPDLDFALEEEDGY